MDEAEHPHVASDDFVVPRKRPLEKRARISKVLLIVVAILGVIYVSAGTLLFVFQRSFVFMADRTHAQPADVGLDDTQAVSLTTSDGVSIVSWFARGSGSRLALYFHGNGGSLAWRGETIATLRQAGLSVLAIDYRGFGGSQGAPSEAGLARDADAAYDEARRLGYAPSQIVLFGESLGSGVAVALAARREVGGLVLDSAYSSIADVAADRYWMFPVRLLLRDTFRSDTLISRIKVPILMLHGTADRVVPIRFGKKLFATAGSNVTFVEVDGAGHLALREAMARQKLSDWLTQYKG